MDLLRRNLETKATSLNLDSEAIQNSMKLLDIYLQHQEIQENEILISCAIYLGCQTVKLFTINGQEAYGNGVTLTQVIRQLAHSQDIEYFLEQLKQFLRTVSHNVLTALKTEMESVIAQAIVNYRIYKKFEKALYSFDNINSDEAHTPWFANDSFQIPQNASISPPSSVCNLNFPLTESQEFRNLAWITFLLLKYEIIQQDDQNDISDEIKLGNTPEIKNTLVLIAHLSLIMLTLKKQERGQQEIDETIKLVARVITPQFITDESEFFEEVRQLMKRCSDQLRKLKIQLQINISGQNQNGIYQYDDIFEEETIKSVLKKFHGHYEKDIRKYNLHLDEECFLRQKLIFTPHKKSALQSGSKHETTNKQLSRIQRDYSQYDVIRKKVKPTESQQLLSPTFKGINEPLFCFTPQPAQKSQLRMYNFGLPEGEKKEKQETPHTPLSGSLSQSQWIKNILTKKSQQAIQALNSAAEQISPTFMEDLKNAANQKIRDYINQLIELGIRQPKVNKIEEDCKIIVQFYEQVLRKMLIQTDDNGNRVVNFLYYKIFLNSLLATCIDTYDFIYKRQGDLQILLQKCEISSVEMWRVLSNFANFDQSMPEQVSQHLLEIEGKLLLFVVWSDSCKEVLGILTKRNQGVEQLRYFEETLLRRLRSHVALRVIELANVLKVEESIKEDTWSFIQRILGEPPDSIELFHERHIDVFIICCFYMILKHKQQERKFELFRQYYSSAFHQEVKFVFPNIIKFYNEYFLKYFKRFIKSGGPSTPQPQSLNSLVSPVAQSVPQAFLQKSQFVKQNSKFLLPEFKPMEENIQIIGSHTDSFRKNLVERINSKNTKS